MTDPLEVGDYVLATKWNDGSPCDHFCIGFLAGYTWHNRYDILDNSGKLFRGNGFRRAERITAEEGKALLRIFPEIANKPGRSLWWHLASLRELPEVEQPLLHETNEL